MEAEERNKFLYETKGLTQCKRLEMVIEFISKAKALCEQEIILDKLYDSMDYKTMGAYESDKYRSAIKRLDEIIKTFQNT